MYIILTCLLRTRRRVHSSLTVGQGDVNESSGVEQSHVSSALGLLGLFLLVNLGGLRLDLTSTRQRTVDLTLILLVFYLSTHEE